ncbi:sulfur reduction protein DsrE [Sinomicrobium pectinilyticum]|uniref:Sulfur reduction protein DsrE n=1 Tax=Sinomicrobium pectinilyticum TaxID=1084421 RepID=A0A3N0EZM6_SINP1|nr:DsrE family protein [Sinomicrobium pectinilyticum]RNL93378.1 sulfur reduction protein DsrE [Sinomicrobium pectinilyticum]
MKNSIIIIFITSMFFSLLGTTRLQAQDFNPKKNNYLILSKNLQQLKPVLLTANELAKEDSEEYGAFYVIICGKTVSGIPDNSDFNALLEDAKAQNVKVFVCAISLNKFNINPDQIPELLEITENGILYGFQLTKKGFITLTI